MDSLSRLPPLLSARALMCVIRYCYHIHVALGVYNRFVRGTSLAPMASKLTERRGKLLCQRTSRTCCRWAGY